MDQLHSYLKSLKPASISLALQLIDHVLDQVSHALLMKEVEKKMMPYGIEYFLRDMGTVVEYYMNNGD